MLLAGFLIRNTPFVSDIVQINLRWSATLRNIALSIILTRAGLGLDPKVWHQLLCKAKYDTDSVKKYWTVWS